MKWVLVWWFCCCPPTVSSHTYDTLEGPRGCITAAKHSAGNTACYQVKL